MNSQNKVLPVLLGQVTLPEQHPRAADGNCVIQSHLIDHPDGLIVVDTGPDMGHPVIDELYQPEVVSIIDAINGAGFDERDVAAVINTHLHFDHCGQNHRFPSAPVWVTEAEVAAAAEPYYTVPDWAAIDDDRRRLSTDGEELASGVRLLHTAGHTPGHQSVAVETVDGLELLVGQACYSCAEFEAATVADGDLHDDSWRDIARASLDRLVAMTPVLAHFSHDVSTG